MIVPRKARKQQEDLPCFSLHRLSRTRLTWSRCPGRKEVELAWVCIPLVPACRDAETRERVIGTRFIKHDVKAVIGKWKLGCIKIFENAFVLYVSSFQTYKDLRFCEQYVLTTRAEARDLLLMWLKPITSASGLSPLAFLYWIFFILSCKPSCCQDSKKDRTLT